MTDSPLRFAHIGLHKTATASLQSLVFPNHPHLTMAELEVRTHLHCPFTSFMRL